MRMDEHHLSFEKPSVDLNSFEPDACTCRYRRRYAQISSEGVVSLASIHRWNTDRHAVDCPLRQQSGKKIRMACSWRLPQWSFARIISISCSLAYDAGGFSLEPVFRVYQVVNQATFPTFVALYDFIGPGHVHGAYDMDYSPQRTQALLQRLFELHRDRGCSPLNVSGRGRTLLEVRMCLVPFKARLIIS